MNYVDPSGHLKSTYSICYYDRNRKNKKLTEQAWHSPYYRTEKISIKSIPDYSNLKRTWNNITNNVSKVFLYLHGTAGALEFNSSGTLCSSKIVGGKNGFKKKPNIKKLYLIVCHGAVGKNKKGKKVSVAKRFYELTDKRADVYASKYYVNFRKAKIKGRADEVYYPKYGGVDKFRDWSGKKNPVQLTYRAK